MLRQNSINDLLKFNNLVGNREAGRRMWGGYKFVGSALAAQRKRGPGSRLLISTLECGLGILAIILIAALVHSWGALLPVALLLYLLVVIPTALLCGFWPAAIVSISAVVVHGFFTLRRPAATDTAGFVSLFAFIVVAITVSWLSARVAVHAKRAERQTAQLRSTVLDNLAQAYKTPLTAIIAAIGGLSEMGGLSATQADLVALIDEQAASLTDLTTRLLTTARLDTGEVAIHAAQVGVEPLIDDVVANLRPRMPNMKVAIDLQDDSLVLCCDRQLMLMLLRQYIDNACKYSTPGTTITIRVEQADSQVIFSVHSFGSVISPADRDGIFDRYFSSTSNANRTASTGIGLSIAKRVAAIHGGSVWVTSEEVEGTTFFAAIPAPV
jgi:K+-sensing histidine kinase KdpD